MNFTSSIIHKFLCSFLSQSLIFDIHPLINVSKQKTSCTYRIFFTFNKLIEKKLFLSCKKYLVLDGKNRISDSRSISSKREKVGTINPNVPVVPMCALVHLGNYKRYRIPRQWATIFMDSKISLFCRFKVMNIIINDSYILLTNNWIPCKQISSY